jgi:uncharacterized protein YjiS (DUF1127 family)
MLPLQAGRTRRTGMIELALPLVRHSAGRLARTLAGIASGAIAVLRRELAIRATAAQLRGLDDPALRDIGIDRSEIESIAFHGGFERLRGR